MATVGYINMTGFDGTALLLAVQRGYFEHVKLLLDPNIDVNISVRTREPAVNFAVSEGHLEIVKFLLMAGADMNIKSDDGMRLHLANESGLVKIAETLLAAGAVDSPSH